MKKRAISPEKTPIYLRVTQNRRSAYISLRKTVDDKFWDDGLGRVKPGHPNYIRMNAFISRTIVQVEEKVLESELKGTDLSVQEIKSVILGKDKVSFTSYANADIALQLKQQNHSRYKKVKGIVTKLNRYTNNRSLEFSDINYEFLKKYEDWLRNTCFNSQNTIHNNLKYFRKLFNDAIREGILEPGDSPFHRYKLRTEKTTRDYLTEDEIMKIELLELEENTSLYHVRNLFVFACYTGIRISDLLCLQVKDFDGTRVSFSMRKTKEQTSILLPSKALSIIKPYVMGKSRTAYIFPYLKKSKTKLDLQKNIMGRTALINKELKILASKAEIDKHLHFHISRHTFATRALRKGIRIEHVSRLLGHSSLKTTQIYTKIANNELDLAMSAFG